MSQMCGVACHARVMLHITMKHTQTHLRDMSHMRKSHMCGVVCRPRVKVHITMKHTQNVIYYNETSAWCHMCGTTHVSDCRESSHSHVRQSSESRCHVLEWNIHIESYVGHESRNRLSRVESFSCVTVIRKSSHILQWNMYIESYLWHESRNRLSRVKSLTRMKYVHWVMCVWHDSRIWQSRVTRESHSCHVTFI